MGAPRQYGGLSEGPAHCEMKREERDANTEGRPGPKLRAPTAKCFVIGKMVSCERLRASPSFRLIGERNE
jgi:hypothetical protein